MITPGNQVPPDDTFDDDADDQQSQKDIHSNGLDDEDDYGPGIDDDADPAELQQAYDAAEPSFTLDFDEDDDDDLDEDV